MSMTEALKTILMKSPNAGNEAMTTLRALQTRSPAVNRRYAYVVEIAFGDPAAQFSPEERAVIVDALDVDDDEPPRSRTLPAVRVTSAEYDHIASAAQAAGQSLSEYIRGKLLS